MKYPAQPNLPSSFRNLCSRAAGVLALALLILLPAPGASADAWQLVDERQVGNLHVLPDEPPTLLARDDGSLWTLTPPDGEWQEIPVPLPEPTESDGFRFVPVDPEVRSLRVAPRDPSRFLVEISYDVRVEQDGELITTNRGAGVIESHDGGETWRGLGLGGQIHSLAIAPGRPDLTYAGIADIRRNPGPPQLVRVEPGDHETTILAIGGEPIPVPLSPWGELAVDAADADHVYSTGSDAVYRSTDGGETWNETSLPAEPRVMIAHPVVAGLALVALEDGSLWRTVDGGDHWQAMGGPAAAEPTGLAWDPLAVGRFYVVAGGVAYATDDAGVTWEALTDGLPGGTDVFGVAIDPADPARLFTHLESGVWQFDRTLPTTPCVADEVTLCLGVGERYEVRVAWQDFQFNAGRGHALPLDLPGDPVADTGAFWFFSPANTELLVKEIDGEPVNGFQWLFYGSLTNVPFTLAVRDTETGEAIGYYNPSQRFASRGDTRAFPDDGYGTIPPEGEVTEPEVRQVAPEPCLPSATTLCLEDGRFAVTVDRFAADGSAIPGQALPGTDDTGYFWFGRLSNLELAVKVLDGRPVNGHHWVFYGALTDVAFELTVTDTVTGRQLVYQNPAGNLASRGDTTAFPADEG